MGSIVAGALGGVGEAGIFSRVAQYDAFAQGDHKGRLQLNGERNKSFQTNPYGTPETNRGFLRQAPLEIVGGLDTKAIGMVQATGHQQELHIAARIFRGYSQSGSAFGV